MSSSINIFVISHKKLNPDRFPGRKIIYVGQNINCFPDNKIIFSDKTKNNISKLNPYYCELTAQYWVWKNYNNSEYVGFEHYRRNFYHCNKIASIDWLLKQSQKYDFYHAKQIRHHTTVEKFWKRFEGKYLFKILDDSIKNSRPDYYSDWQIIAQRKKMTYCNIFVCKKSMFDKYMKFIFPILNDSFKRIKKLNKKQQLRSIGFMAERLFDVFLHHNHLTHKAGFVRFNKKCKNIFD